ncbi:MAG: hypothetical protein H6672_09415 [Anaerolineaceae bacterium]|nr:hypothetical protein [Anaerolineaceae bacterium]
MMEAPTIEILVKLVEQLSEDEQVELVRRIEALLPPRQRPSDTLRVFHVEHFPENMTLRREDEYDDDSE